MADFSQQVAAAQAQYTTTKAQMDADIKLKNSQATEQFRTGLQQMKQTASDLASAQAGQTRLSGQFMLANPGEKIANVQFPFYFAEKPLLSFGAEIPTGDNVIKGQYPTASVMIGGWLTYDNPPFTQLFYGAKFIIVTTGPPQQRFYVHWHLDGVAYNGDIGVTQVF
jgi:hypothetical protein